MSNTITTEDIKRFGRMKWEYKSEKLSRLDLESLDDKLNAYGADGWLLTAIDNGLFIFRRQTEGIR